MKQFFIISVLFVAISSQLSAQQTITLNEARERALSANKDVKKSQLTREQVSYDAASYKSLYYPRVNLIAADYYSTAKGDITISGGHLPIYYYNAEAGQYIPNVTPNADGSYTLNQYADFPDQKMEYKIKNVLIGGIQLQQPLYMGGKITAAYNMAQIGQQMATENIRLSENEVIVNTDEAYIQAVRAKELANVARSYQTLLQELQKNVDAAVRHGMKTHNDQLKVQVKLNEAQLSIQKADNAYRLARMNLCHLMGLPLDTHIEVVSPDNDALADFQANADVNSSTALRPEHNLMRAKAELAEKQVKLTKSEFMPNLALIGGYNYMNGGELAGKKLIDSGSGYVAVTFKMPLITFGERTNKVNSARAKHQIALLEQQDIDEKLTLQLTQSINNLEEAQSEVALTKESLKQAEENMKQSKQLYEVGIEPLSDYLDAQALWQKASADVVEARCQQLLAHTKYLRASGKLK